ncbi:unnamed protein product, partial [Ilex paraguariensis]
MGFGRIVAGFMKGVTVVVTLKGGLEIVKSIYSKEPSNRDLGNKIDGLSQHTTAKFEEQTNKILDAVEKCGKSTGGSGAGPA